MRRLERFWEAGIAREIRSSEPFRLDARGKTDLRIESNRISGGAAGRAASSGKEETAGAAQAWVWTLEAVAGGEEKGVHDHGVYSEG